MIPKYYIKEVESFKVELYDEIVHKETGFKLLVISIRKNHFRVQDLSTKEIRVIYKDYVYRGFKISFSKRLSRL